MQLIENLNILKVPLLVKSEIIKKTKEVTLTLLLKQ